MGRMKSASKHLRGSLSFIKDWEYFTDLNDPEFESLTTTGPYAGTLEAFIAIRRQQDFVGADQDDNSAHGGQFMAPGRPVA